MTSPGHRACCVLLSGLLLTLAGCGGNDSMARLSGAVTLDGQPVAAGTITIIPRDGNAPTTGGEIKEGQYSVEAPLGVMKVSLSAPKVVGKKKIYNTADSPEMTITAEALPARYNQKSELTVEVVSGDNRKDFDLKSDK